MSNGVVTESTKIGRTAIRPAAPRLSPNARSYLVAGVLILLLAAAGGAWWNLSRPAPVSYTTAPATRGPVVRSVTATGTVNPVLTIIVGSYVSGVIQDIYCDYNTKVKKGQLCAKIDPRPYQTLVDQDRANLAVAKAQLLKDQANLAYAKLSWQRNEALVKRGWVSQDTADSAQSTYNQAQAQIELDNATIQQRQAALSTSEVNLGYTSIVSPVDGTVVSRNVTIGQTVAASFQTPTLFLIGTDLTQMEVDTNVSESDIGGIKEGNAASFTVEAFPDRPFNGVVAQVRQAPQTIQNVVTFDVVVNVDNGGLLLKPGMTATTKIVTARRDDVLRVPDQALRYAPGGAQSAAGGEAPAGAAKPAQVWVLRDGRPTPVTVGVGLDDDSYSEILSGDLAPGDRVILSERRSGSGAGQSMLRAPRL